MRDTFHFRFLTVLTLILIPIVALLPQFHVARGETTGPDLEVSLTTDTKKIVFRYDDKGHLSKGNSTVLNATVTNRGDPYESDVLLQLFINNTSVLNATTSRLEINGTFWSSYFWAPLDANYSVTVYAPPVSGESNTANNNVTRFVQVCQDLPPIANFTYWPPPPAPGPINNETATFDATESSDPDWGTILNYTWNFGDSNVTTVSYPQITHRYEMWGNRTVTLTLRDTENLNNSVSKNITVYARPSANFRIDPPTPYFVDQVLTFNATASYDPDNNTGPSKGIANYTWNFDDGNTTLIGDDEPITPFVNHSYTMEKDYNATLTVTDYHGLTSVVFPRLIRVSLGGPVANFTVMGSRYVGYPLTFDASESYDPNNKTASNNGIANYTWDFNDGNITSITEPAIVHQYQTPKTYMVNLTVTDCVGLTNSTVKAVAVTLEVLLKAVDFQTGETSMPHNPADLFKINITVTNVVDLFSYEVNLTWPGARYPILEVTDVQRGDFLSPEDFESGVGNYQGYVLIRSSRVGTVNGVNGNGTLATITFHVNNTMTGNCTLSFAYSILKNSTWNNIPHTPDVANFYTTQPVANFTYSPPYPSATARIDFNASASYDPDTPYDNTPGPISTYTWNFEDGNITTIGDDEPATPIIDHRYEENGTYQVLLSVTDDDGDTWNFTDSVVVGYSHDVAVIAVEPWLPAFNNTTSEYETAGKLNITVTISNLGTALMENFNVTVYAKNDSRTFEIETRTVSLSAGSSRNETFYLYTFLLNSTYGIPKGNYTITANATLESDVNLSNNDREGGIVRVYPAGDVNHDYVTNMRDIGNVTTGFNSRVGESKYSASLDLNCDGIVNMRDIGIAANSFMKDP